MLQTDFFFAATGIVLAWAVLALVIRNWGTGFPNRSVRCPERDVRATISTACHTTNGWGRGVQKDVLACSLLPGKPVTCSKSCLAQL